MKKFNVVQIGVGHDHAYGAISSLSHRENVNLLGYVKFEGEDATFNKHFKRYEGIPQLSLEQVYNLKDLDAVFIETEDKYLTRYAYEFVKRGIAVQMDKPGSQDRESFNKLFNLAKEKNVVLHTGYMYRYNPAIQKLIHIVKSGELGDILYIEAQMNCIHSEEKRKWLKDYKGGMMYFLGCHLVDLLFQLKGAPDEIIPLNSATNENVGEDIGFAVFKYGNNCSFIKSTAVELGGYLRRQIVVCGEKGTIEINPIENYSGVNSWGDDKYESDMYIALSANGGDGWGFRANKIEIGPFERYETMYDEFFKILNGEMANPYSYDYEMVVHDLLLKACGVQ